MKSFKISTTVIIALFITSVLISCKDNKKMNHESMRSMSGDKMTNLNKKSLESTKIIDNYFQIKNALFEDNKNKAAEAGKMMLTSFSNFDTNKLTDSEHKKYKKIAESANDHIKHIIEGSIDHQRKYFKALSSDIKSLIILVGSEKTIYQDFCPMYNDGNGKGAIWLSEFKEIKNPYFGNNSKYLTCGAKQKKL